MTRFLPKLYLDISSFYAGIILVVLVLVLILIYRKRIRSFFTRTSTNLINFRESLSVTSDADYIQVLYKYLQGLHICADYFPLESVLVPTRCIAPPPYLFPTKKSLDTSLIQQVIGYDPLLPELNSEFFGPTFPLLDAVQTGTDLCLVGFPGTGKTTAIAECMAALIKPGDEENPQDPVIPFYVKAHHMLAQFPGRDMLGMLLKAIQLNKSFLVIPNFPKYLTNAIKSTHAVLFLDDMDSLALEDINRLANFITALKRQIPYLQIVATASPSCLGTMVTSPLEFISVSPWSNQEKYAFLDRLSGAWPALQPIELPEEQESYSVLNSMLVVSGKDLSPLEFTLRAIAAYGGDLPGQYAVDALEAYLKRDLPFTPDDLNTMELIAVYCLESQKSSFSRRSLSAWFEDVYKQSAADPSAVKFAPFQTVIQTAIDHHLLQADPDSSYHFTHPTILGFLSAKGLSKTGPRFILRILESPDWGPMRECMRYFGAFHDLKPYLKPLLGDRSPLKNKLLRASLWLEYLRPGSDAETSLLKQITREIHSNTIYLIKIRLVCALTRSRNPQVKGIFQHLLQSKEMSTRRAAAVGLGLLQDLSAVPPLIKQLNDGFPSSTAACYALGKIGSPRSLEAIAEALLHGGELLRRAAAESLAQNRSEGHPALREGVTMDDLLVRYAVVHGLGMINEPWSLEILDKMRIDENEWVVRDLAQQTYEILDTRSPYLPQNTPQAHETLWLRDFAAEQDLPHPTPENSLDYLLKALELGTDEQKQNSLAQIARTGKTDLIPVLLETVHAEKSDLADQAALAVWFCAPQRYKIIS